MALIAWHQHSSMFVGLRIQQKMKRTCSCLKKNWAVLTVKMTPKCGLKSTGSWSVLVVWYCLQHNFGNLECARRSIWWNNDVWVSNNRDRIFQSALWPNLRKQIKPLRISTCIILLNCVVQTGGSFANTCLPYSLEQFVVVLLSLSCLMIWHDVSFHLIGV